MRKRKWLDRFMHRELEKIKIATFYFFLTMPRQRKRGGRDQKKQNANGDTAPMDETSQEPFNDAGMADQQQGFQGNNQEYNNSFNGHGQRYEIDEQTLGYFKGVESTIDDPPFETAEGRSKSADRSVRRDC